MRRLLYRSPCWRRALYHGLWRLPSRLSYVDGRGRVLLSFDDGPSENSLRIGEELARRGQRALFFLRADRLAAPGRTATSSQRRCAEICGALLRRGHLPGNHGLDHLRLALRSPATVREQIAEAAERLGIACGRRPVFFRPPFGSWAPWLNGQPERLGQRSMFWSVGAGDYGASSASLVVERLRGLLRAGDILLLHCTGRGESHTAAALPGILDLLEDRDLAPLDPRLLLEESP